MSLMPEFYNSPEFSKKSNEERFKLLLESYCSQVTALGMTLVPYTPKTFERFQSFDAEKQEKVISNLLVNYEVYASAIINNVDIEDNHSLVWWALKKLNLRPPSDLFANLEKGDVVEIYNSELVQIFRTFNFFRVCHYSLDQILTYDWVELYKRDEQLTQKMIGICVDVISGKLPGVTMPRLPDHYVDQIQAPNSQPIKINHRLVSALSAQDNGIFMANVFKVTPASH